MTRNDIYNLPKCAGIYCIKNTISGKCYIGQAIKIQKRLKTHLNCYNNPIYEHIALYKDIKEYGIENFEVTVLEKFTDALSWRTKLALDQLEEKYIQKYNNVCKDEVVEYPENNFKDEFMEYAKSHSKEECLSHFNIPEKLYYKYCKQNGDI